MLAKGMMTGVMLDPDHSSIGQYAACKYGKATHVPIRKAHDPQHTKNLGDKIHTDIWGPLPIQTPGKQSYYCSFTNDHTCYTQISLMHAKLETFNAYLRFESWLKTQHGKVVKQLYSDCGGEYLSNEFTCHLKTTGTERKLTTHDMPKHNKVAKCLN